MNKRFTELYVIIISFLNSVFNFQDVGSKSTELGISSGVYNMELILGDAVISNPIRWNLGVLELKLGTVKESTPVTPVRGVRPEIKHMFREPERRPPQVISTTFTVLAAAPLLILFIMWAKLGINIKNFKFNLSTILFHAGLAGEMFYIFLKTR